MKRWASVLGIVATVVGILAGFAAIGWALPWTAETKESAAAKYETKEHASIVYENLEAQHQAVLESIRAELESLNKKLPERSPEPPRR